MSEASFFVDDEPKERAAFDAVALEPSQSVVIQACAGSGKTWILVARIKRLLLAGAEPGEILGITFTRKAAEEIRERLVSDLEALAFKDEAEVLKQLEGLALSRADAVRLLPRARALFEQVLSAPVPMTLDTFHGWFGKLVRNAPVGSGVPGGLSLTERTGPLRRAAKRRFLSELERAPEVAQAYRALLSDLGESNTWKALEGLIERRNEWHAYLGERSARERIEDAFGAELLQEQPDPRAVLFADPSFLAEYRMHIALLQQGGTSAAARGDAAAAIVATPGFVWNEETAAALEAPLRLKTSLRPQKFESEVAAAAARGTADPVAALAAVEAARARLQRLFDALARATAASAARAHALLNDRVARCGEVLLAAYTAAKRAAGALDFGDLEWWAFALAHHPDTAAYIQVRLDARYRHVLVDEFQDTNPLQWQTLRQWFDAYGADGSRPSVLIVGDALQSIYGFRRADARLFAEAERYLVEHYGARRLRTQETRRCALAVVDLVNRVFADRPGFRAHTSHRSEPGSVARLALAVPTENAAVPVKHRLRDVFSEARAEDDLDAGPLEAETIARAILGVVGSWTVTDKVHGPRVARFDDILILVRRREPIAELEASLRRAGIPFQSDRAGGLLATIEASDLSALLGFLVAPHGDLDLAQVLRSPMMGASDEDLIVLAGAARGRPWWPTLERLNDPSVALARARTLLGDWLAAATVLPVHDLLDRVYAKGEVLARYEAALPADASEAEREQVRSNLVAYLELALELDSGRYPSLTRFIEELDDLARASDQESPDEAPLDDGHAVRILTVHGAKGLEAPIVFVADSAHARPPRPSYQIALDWPPGAARPARFGVMRSRASPPPGWEGLAAEDDAAEEREDWNLLYVAATRARDHLIFSGAMPRKGDRSDRWYARVEAAVPLFDPPVVNPGERVGATRMLRDFRPERFPVGARRSAEAVRGVGLGAGADERTRQEGILMHRLLELGTSGQELSLARARTLGSAAGLAPAASEAVYGRARAILAAPHLERFFDPGAYRRAYSEVELIDGAGALVRLDRLVEFEEEWWILDYKSATSAVGIEPFRNQLEHYRAAVRALSGAPARIAAAVVFSDTALIELDGADGAMG